MLRMLALSIALTVLPIPAEAGNNTGIVTVDGHHDVPTTVERLTSVIAEKGLTLVATVDHAAAAESAGLTLRPTVLLVFGNPKVGTPMMQAAPTSALDLPLKVLIYRADDGTTKLAYNDPTWMAIRHQAAGVPSLSTMRKALPALVDHAASE